ncbi:unnamed protein product [Musa acuminata subsp. burmannicoides]
MEIRWKRFFAFFLSPCRSPLPIGPIRLIDNSPYQLHVNANESFYLCTTSPLNEREVKLLKQRTHDLYQANMIFDNLHVRRFTEQNGVTFQWTGFPIGYTPAGSSEYYIINHLKFKVLVHEYEGNRAEIISTGVEGTEDLRD